MPVVKFDMSGVDPDESMKSDFMQPPPGLHRCKIISCDPGKSKAGNPMLTVVVRPVEGNYAQVWNYLTFSDEDFPRRKMDQFLQAVGVASKTKRTGSFNPDSVVGKIVKVNIRAKRPDAGTPDHAKNEYRAEITDMLPDTDELDEFDASMDSADEEFDADSFEDDTADAEAADGLYTADEIEAMDVDALKEALGTYEVKAPRGRPNLPKLREMLLEAQAEYCEAEGVENPADTEAPEDEDEEEMEDEEPLADDGDDEFLTEAQLKDMSKEDLIKTAKEFDVKVAGKRPTQVIKDILAAQGADEDPF